MDVYWYNFICYGAVAQWLEQSAQLTIWLSLGRGYVTQHDNCDKAVYTFPLL